MKHKTYISMTILLVLLLSSCSAATADTGQGQEYAYYEIFLSMWCDDVSVISVDLSETKIEDKEAAYALMEAYCTEKGVGFLSGNMEYYCGYEVSQDYEECADKIVALTFNDKKLTNNTLVTEVSTMWVIYGEGFGTLYKVTKKSGVWEIENYEETWIT